MGAKRSIKRTRNTKRSLRSTESTPLQEVDLHHQGHHHLLLLKREGITKDILEAEKERGLIQEIITLEEINIRLVIREMTQEKEGIITKAIDMMIKGNIDRISRFFIIKIIVLLTQLGNLT